MSSAGEWIAVSERLPEVDDDDFARDLLLSDGETVLMGGMIKHDWCPEEPVVWYENDFGRVGGVTHWCKPVPPK